MTSHIDKNVAEAERNEQKNNVIRLCRPITKHPDEIAKAQVSDGTTRKQSIHAILFSHLYEKLRTVASERDMPECRARTYR